MAKVTQWENTHRAFAHFSSQLFEFVHDSSETMETLKQKKEKNLSKSVHSTLVYVKCRAKQSHSVSVGNRHRKQCLPNTQSNKMFVARMKNKKRHKKAGQNPFEMLLPLSKHEQCEHEQQGAHACVFLIIVARRTFSFICCFYIVKFVYSRRISLSTTRHACDEEENTEKLM